jgi:hypothetical protein
MMVLLSVLVLFFVFLGSFNVVPLDLGVAPNESNSPPPSLMFAMAFFLVMVLS